MSGLWHLLLSWWDSKSELDILKAEISRLRANKAMLEMENEIRRSCFPTKDDQLLKAYTELREEHIKETFESF